jgi:hypothetical protein
VTFQTFLARILSRSQIKYLTPKALTQRVDVRTSTLTSNATATNNNAHSTSLQITQRRITLTRLGIVHTPPIRC